MLTMAKNVCKKKLTYSGGGVCVMTCIAALLAMCAPAGNYIGGLLYTQFFSKQVFDMSFELDTFLYNNIAYIPMALFSLVIMFWAFSAAKYKRMGREFGWVSIFMSITLSLHPALLLYILSKKDNFIGDYFNSNYDSDKFIGSVILAKICFPIIAGLLILIAGIVVLARIGGEDFVVEVPRRIKNKKEKVQTVSTPEYTAVPENSEQESAFGFGENTQPVQGLTGETKPATYNEDPNAVTPKRPSVKLCPKCGELVGDDELFCSNCGYRM
ncbi:hypothetical protein Rumal_0025 [Ruminococcus albus 7 = DSM 20455]|uniref:Zinc-ribbon domain-containing protein n=2 Tax=Ruminococcus albus TaxID=1264 RepID=E6UB47_RUMA7|nr:hypothetical protein Rumal_0025 [Ruminococcus albus 7 = DSM 20455]